MHREDPLSAPDPFAADLAKLQELLSHAGNDFARTFRVVLTEQDWLIEALPRDARQARPSRAGQGMATLSLAAGLAPVMSTGQLEGLVPPPPALIASYQALPTADTHSSWTDLAPVEAWNPDHLENHAVARPELPSSSSLAQVDVKSSVPQASVPPASVPKAQPVQAPHPQGIAAQPSTTEPAATSAAAAGSARTPVRPPSKVLTSVGPQLPPAVAAAPIELPPLPHQAKLTHRSKGIRVIPTALGPDVPESLRPLGPDIPASLAQRYTNDPELERIVAPVRHLLGGQPARIAPASRHVAAQTTSEVVLPSGKPRWHTIRKGETLIQLARRYYDGRGKHWLGLFAFNRDRIRSAHRVFPGERIQIPDFEQVAALTATQQAGSRKPGRLAEVTRDLGRRKTRIS
ncbi:MAG: hypothetical protein VKO21_01300 [Candidatus Sericytochromatia bacterium]|nr:hypothetical protein [Candidatus Sericytochromatia bacterium]